MFLFLVFLSLIAGICNASQSGIGSPINTLLNGYNGNDTRDANLENNYLKSETKVVDGEEADPHEFPWLLVVNLYKRQKPRYGCGASIINENWALTAAHCVEGEHDFSVRVVAGEHDLSEKEGTEVERNISRIIIHRDFSGEPDFKNDIALLKFKTPMRFNDYIQPINLAGRNRVTTGNVVGVGWGDTSNPQAKPSDVLLKAQIPVVPLEKCKKQHPQNDVDDHQICAGHTGRKPDSCKGEPGGPLVQKARRGNNHILVGIVAYGSQCGQPRTPTVYTSIAKYRKWIDGCSDRSLAEHC